MTIEIPIGGLIHHYVTEKKSIRWISNLYGVSTELIRRRLKQYGVPVRHGGEAIETQWINNPARRKKQSEFYLSNVVKSGQEHPNWKGGTEINDSGYILQYDNNHPKSHKNKVRAHRLIMENYLGRYIDRSEVVHHINGNRTDNRIENLLLMTNSEHSKYHWSLKR
uniref:Putative homing endonuclease n=1 Tax=viral metagenome TaxID=1070528 RepID=A0A6M3KF57_9ZZZZ